MSKGKKSQTPIGARLEPEDREWVAWCCDSLLLRQSDVLRAAIRILRINCEGLSNEIEMARLIRQMASGNIDEATIDCWASGVAKIVRQVSAKRGTPPPRPGVGKATS